MDGSNSKIKQIKQEYIISTFIATVIILIILSDDFNTRKIILTVLFSWAFIVIYIYLNQEEKDHCRKLSKSISRKEEEEYFHVLSLEEYPVEDDFFWDDELL